MDPTWKYVPEGVSRSVAKLHYPQMLKDAVLSPIRQVYRYGRTVLRELTAPMRLWPDFIVIGAQRCGTTFLHSYFTDHPNAAPAREKEVHFFDLNFARGTSWYRAHFPSYLYRYYVQRASRKPLVTGEATPYYMFHPHAPRRVWSTVPQCKLIVMLRNPVDRAYSHYQHEVRTGAETLTFEAALDREPERLRGELERMHADESYYSYNHHHYAYVARGTYVDQLRRWMSLFPREQFLIIGSEKFFRNPSAIFRRVTEFVRIPRWEPRTVGKLHYPGYQEIAPATRTRLLEYFKPYNQELYNYLGMDFGWDA